MQRWYNHAPANMIKHFLLIQTQVAVIVWDFLFIILKKYGNTLRYSRTCSLNDEALQPTI